MRPQPTPAARRFAVLALGAGVLAAVALPGNRHGLGVVLVALAVAAALEASGQLARGPFRLALTALGLALAAMAAVRATSWLVTLDCLAALTLLSLATRPASSFGAVRRGALAFVPRLPAAPAFVARCTGVRSRDLPLGRLLPAARGLALGGGLVVMFGALFVSADRAFARLAGDVLPSEVDLGELPARVFAFLVVVALAGALTLAAGREPAPERDTRARGSHPFEWLVAVAMLDLLFGVFVGVQLAVLFGGHDHVLRTEGLTYAEYARQGFSQLLVVSLLTLAVVAAARRGAGRRDARLDILLCALSLLTLVVVASAVRRLGLYEEAFGFTVARLAGMALALWVGGVLLLAMAAGVARREEWLPRALVLLSGAALLAFSVINPEGVVAGHNVERFRETGKLDRVYAATLGEDAAPALARLPEPVARCVLATPTPPPNGLFELNAGRARARGVLEGIEPLPERSPC